jgi:hypothetical protein
MSRGRTGGFSLILGGAVPRRIRNTLKLQSSCGWIKSKHSLVPSGPKGRTTCAYGTRRLGGTEQIQQGCTEGQDLTIAGRRNPL